jgi:hypothetical protein
MLDKRAEIAAKRKRVLSFRHHVMRLDFSQPPVELSAPLPRRGETIRDSAILESQAQEFRIRGTTIFCALIC